MTSNYKIENGYENGEFFIKVYDENNNLLLSLPKGGKKYQGHNFENGKLYIGIYVPEVGPATYELTDKGLVLVEKIEH